MHQAKERQQRAARETQALKSTQPPSPTSSSQDNPETWSHNVRRRQNQSLWPELPSRSNHGEPQSTTPARPLGAKFRLDARWVRPTVVNATKCIFGPQSKIYTGLDFTDVLTCERRPIIVDLPPTKAEDRALGKIPSCCRNRTILPRIMDPSKSASVFTMQKQNVPFIKPLSNE